MAESPFLIVGLGNPGPKYALTRHNVGFMVVDLLADRWGGGKATGKFHGEVFSFPDRKAVLLKPQTFMNLSGKSLVEAVGFYKVEPAGRLMVISDDLDLPPAQIRIRKSGGAGGHNGLKSVVELLGTEEFPRLRIGIGRPPGPTEGYVLANLPKAEQALFADAVATAADAVETWMNEGLDKMMNVFNRKKDEP